MTTPIAPIKNVPHALDETLHLIDPARAFIFPDDVAFYLEGESLDAHQLNNLRLSFSLMDKGRCLTFLGSDDTMYFAQFDRRAWIETAVQNIIDSAEGGMPVYIEGQLSGKPRGLVVTASELARVYPQWTPEAMPVMLAQRQTAGLHPVS